jgi:hypothetical protein
MNKNADSSTEDRPVRGRGRNPKFQIGPDMQPLSTGLDAMPTAAAPSHPIPVDPNGAPMDDYYVDPTAPYQDQVNDIYSAPTMPTLPSPPGVPPAPGLAGLHGKGIRLPARKSYDLGGL